MCAKLRLIVEMAKKILKKLLKLLRSCCFIAVGLALSWCRRRGAPRGRVRHLARCTTSWRCVGTRVRATPIGVIAGSILPELLHRDQLMAERLADEFSNVARICFVQQLLAVVLNGVDGDVHLLCNLPTVEALGKEFQHLELS